MFTEHIALENENLNAVNTLANPDAVVPHIRQGSCVSLGKESLPLNFRKRRGT